MVEGSCLCGGVRFEIDERAIIVVNHCHCSYCRKVSGSAFGTFVQLPGSAFRWLAGRELVKTYESTPGNFRAFCGVCGSRMPQSQNWERHVTVPAGALDGDPHATPALHIYVASKAPWYTIRDDLPALPGMGTEQQWRDAIANRGGA